MGCTAVADCPVFGVCAGSGCAASDVFVNTSCSGCNFASHVALDIDITDPGHFGVPLLIPSL